MQDKVKRETLSLDFIAGLIVGEGSFFWTKIPQGRVPGFAIRMHVRDKTLVNAVKESLQLSESIYEYMHNDRHYVHLSVRSIGSLKNKIIPFLYPRLAGYKRQQFLVWFKGFYDPEVVEWFQFFPRALRHQFPELCDEQLLAQLIIQERMSLQQKAEIGLATPLPSKPLKIWPWE